jgi:hypothetical protein
MLAIKRCFVISQILLFAKMSGRRKSYFSCAVKSNSYQASMGIISLSKTRKAFSTFPDPVEDRPRASATLVGLI